MPDKDKKKAQDIAMSPQEIAAANKDGISYLKQEFPMLTMDQGMGYANMGMGNLINTAMPIMTGMVQSGYENFDRNPAKQATATLADQTLGTNTSDQFTPEEPELSPYERRIRELMANRGMTREQAVANQAGAMQAGGDINDNGAITNNEWAIKLGSDFDNDGTVSNQEFAQWKQQNPDHQAAGGTQRSGLMAPAPQQGYQAQQPQIPPGMAAQQVPQVAQQPTGGYVPNGFMGGQRRGRR